MADLVKVRQQDDDPHGGQLVLELEDGSILAAVVWGPLQSKGNRFPFVEVFSYTDGLDNTEESEWRWEGR
jgi:hypothetical protein